MNKIPLIIFFTLLVSNSFSQTYRTGFDNIENSPSAGYGQGGSMFMNINGYLNNVESAYLSSYITMFKATKEKQYLDKFIIHAKRVQERRDDNVHHVQVANKSPCQNVTHAFNKSSKGWSVDETKPGACDGWVQPVLHSGVITFPMAEFVYLMKKDPGFMALANEPVQPEAQNLPACNGTSTASTYSDFAGWLRCRVNETIQFHEPYWCNEPLVTREKSNVANYMAYCGEPPAHLDDWEYGGVGYHHDTTNLCCRVREPVNMQCAMGKTLALMYLVESGKEGHAAYASTYWKHISDIATDLHGNFLLLNPDDSTSYIWCHKSDCTCFEDGFHAYLVMELADICFKNNTPDYYGVVNPLFSLTDMQRFSNTFAKHMYKAPLTFAKTVMGTDDVCEGGGLAYSPYVFLSQYNPYIYQQISDVVCEGAIYNSSGSLIGLADLALYRHLFNPIALQRNQYRGAWEASASGDFDGNGTTDFVAVNSSSGYFHIHTLDTCRNNSELNNCINWVAQNSSSINGNWVGIAADDFNPDHAGDEFIALNKSNKHAYYFEQSGSTIAIIGELVISNGTDWSAVTAGNYDGQAGNEALALRTDGSVFMIKYNAGTGLQEYSGFDSTGVSNAVGLVTGNFVPDNPNPQVAILDNASGNVQVFQISFDSSLALFQFSLLYRSTETADSNNGWNGITAGDFDGDGIDEIMAHRNVDGQFFVFKVKNNQLAILSGEYFPVDQQNGVMCAARFSNFPEKDALVTFRNYDGQVTIFNMKQSGLGVLKH